VGRTNDLIVLPTLAVASLPLPALIPGLSMTFSEVLNLSLFEELQAIEKMTHGFTLFI
jgi:hypothetical protein